MSAFFHHNLSDFDFLSPFHRRLPTSTASPPSTICHPMPCHYRETSLDKERASISQEFFSARQRHRLTTLEVCTSIPPRPPALSRTLAPCTGTSHPPVPLRHPEPSAPCYNPPVTSCTLPRVRNASRTRQHMYPATRMTRDSSKGRRGWCTRLPAQVSPKSPSLC